MLRLGVGDMTCSGWGLRIGRRVVVAAVTCKHVTTDVARQLVQWGGRWIRKASRGIHHHVIQL